MHDPMTVAFEIPNFFLPAREIMGVKYRDTLITIWHVDPQKDGTDDSCGYCFPKLTKQDMEIINRYLSAEYEYPISLEAQGSDPEIISSLVKATIREYKRATRSWYRHPKYHFWHWHFQIHPLQHFKRWAFSRCNKCGGRFKWGESPGSDHWNGTGPLWFKSEDVYHMNCSRKEIDKTICK